MDLPQPKLKSGPWLMAVLNVTPDSFSRDGRFGSPSAAIDSGFALAEAGADVIDIGGDAIRPGAPPTPAEEEIARVLPVIEALAKAKIATLSIDTMKPEVARAAIAAGATMWNDISALAYAPDSVATAVALDCPVVLMHMQGEPHAMQANPVYGEVVSDVAQFLAERAEIAEAAGVRPENIWVDPGLGFGKLLEHNLDIIRGIGEIRAYTERRLVFAASRKGFIGAIEERWGRPVSDADERLGGSLAAALAAWEFGADMLRVHDVAETVQALRVWLAIGDGV
ncbi:MAG: dihydropteroate synthase [Caulobacterales bacterium]|jgi:dihydropteroate synthase